MRIEVEETNTRVGKTKMCGSGYKGLTDLLQQVSISHDQISKRILRYYENVGVIKISWGKTRFYHHKSYLRRSYILQLIMCNVNNETLNKA